MNLNKLNDIAVSKDFIANLSKEYSIYELHEYFVLRTKAKVFSHNEKVDMARVNSIPNLQPLQIFQLKLFLAKSDVKKSENRFDPHSYKPEGTKSVTFKPTEVVYEGENEVHIKVISNIMKGHTLGTMTAIATSAAVKDVRVGISEKTNTFHKLNEFAPRPEGAQVLSQISAGCSSATAMSEAARLVDSANIDQARLIREALIETIPDEVVTEEGKKVKKPLVKIQSYEDNHRKYFTKDGTEKLYPPTFTFAKRKGIRHIAVSGELSRLMTKFEQYHGGITNSMVVRAGYTAWNGVPLKEVRMEHIIALYDAGVRSDSVILINSADQTLISLIRSNITPHAWGIGNGKGLILNNDIQKYYYDYVYYPHPIPFVPSGGATEALRSTAEYIRNMFLPVAGKKIFHMSPLAYFSREIATYLGQVIVKDTGITPMSTLKQRDIEWKEKKVHEPHNSKVVPIKPVPMMDAASQKTVFKYITAITTGIYESSVEKQLQQLVATHAAIGRSDFMKYHEAASKNLEFKLPQDKTSPLNWYSIKDFSVKMRPTLLSYSGTLMYCDEFPSLTMDEAIGISLVLARNTFRSVWSVMPLTENEYTVNYITSAHKIDNLDFDDDMFYSAEALAEIDEMIESGAIQIGHQKYEDKQEEDDNYDKPEEAELDFD